MRTTIFLMLWVTSAQAQVDSVKTRNQRVQRAFLKFSSVPLPEQQANRLETLRDRDRLQLYGATLHDAQAGYGVALFSAMTIFTAHAPPKVRALFDGPVHLGPAVFDYGGMGVGIGGRFYL